MHNRKALAWLMVGLLVLAGCSSTPRVVETQPNPNAVSAATRALIEADPHFQLVARLAAQESKHPDWSKATQTADSNGRLVIQVPIWWDENNLELLIATIEQEQVLSILLSRVTFEKTEQSTRLAFSDLSTNLVVTGLVKPSQGRPVFHKIAWGVRKGTHSLDGLFEVQAFEKDSLQHQQANCAEIIANFIAATAALVAATYSLYASCNPFTFWTPVCLAALVGYSLAVSTYYYWLNQLNRYGCVY
ncbi:hypothetical protein [Meiothermus cerbereus]|uniref:hypothetical protein n=1 Tax=Meiothermus cerbereus TaxID=65552 RepID=UPI000481B083|nr:hypothetical protein [Meiothermus cerbereus]